MLILLGAIGVAAICFGGFVIYAVSWQARDQRRQQLGLAGAETFIVGTGGSDASHAHTGCSTHASVDCGGHGGH